MVYADLKKDYARIREENARLKEENTSVKKTVSVLAAKAINVKTETPDKSQKNKKSKHQRRSRTSPKEVDEEKVVDQIDCNVCGNELSEPTDAYCRTVEEIAPAKKVVTRYIITRRYCKHCKKQVSARVHDALPNERFGKSLGPSKYI